MSKAPFWRRAPAVKKIQCGASEERVLGCDAGSPRGCRRSKLLFDIDSERHPARDAKDLHGQGTENHHPAASVSRRMKSRRCAKTPRLTLRRQEAREEVEVATKRRFVYRNEKMLKDNADKFRRCEAKVEKAIADVKRR